MILKVKLAQVYLWSSVMSEIIQRTGMAVRLRKIRYKFSDVFFELDESMLSAEFYYKLAKELKKLQYIHCVSDVYLIDSRNMTEYYFNEKT